MTRDEFVSKKWRIGQTVYFLTDVVQECEVTEINSKEDKNGVVVTHIYIEPENKLGRYVSYNSWCEYLFSNKKKAQRAQVSIQKQLKNGLR